MEPFGYYGCRCFDICIHNNGNFCIGIVLNLRKAFDSCSHDVLLKKLEKLGIKGAALLWFSSN
jgi:hypothetical protein